MKIKTVVISSIFAATAAIYFGSSAQSLATIVMPVSIVGNPGNAADTTGYGSVGYTFGIGTFDVTEAQYTAFLNAVAITSDPYGLYSSYMATAGNSSGSPTGAGIAQTGSAGGYSYAVMGTSGNDPVTAVSWFDAARFCNWMNNGQPMGAEGTATTETGAYTLNGDMTSGMETKNINAQWWIPSENEWYKAAYYDPNKGGLGVGGYWSYATRSSTAPGNVVGSGTNQANYKNGVYSVTQSPSLNPTQNYLTPVGAFTNSASAYGTFDQSGDVYNWNDSIISGSFRGLRGGSWYDNASNVNSSNRAGNTPRNGTTVPIGFRVATVPEPSSIMLMGLGVVLLAAFRRNV